MGMLAQWCRQPVLLAYLVGGVAVGPLGLKLVQDRESIHTIAELGLMFLLFMIGLEIDLKKVLRAGRAVLVTAMVQIVGGCLLGLALFWAMGYALGGGQWDALYLAVAAALSSTVIIVKVLYDKRELDTLAGRITLGILVLQDLFAILFLAVQPSLGAYRPAVLFLSLGQAAVLLAVALVVSRYVLPPLFKTVARVPELLLVGALAWCFVMAELAQALHLSREMGALVAGVAISTFPYAVEVISRVTTLRDFFVTLFFVSLGMLIPQPSGVVLAGCLGFAAVLLVTRIGTVFTPLHRMGLGLRMSVLPAIYLCQVSEFSLVILQLGRQSGHVSEDTTGVVFYAFVVLAAISTWGMAKSDATVQWIIPRLRRVGLKDLDSDSGPGGVAAEGGEANRARVLLLGFYQTASALLEELSRNTPELLPHLAVVDYNPEVRQRLQQRGVRVFYGDISQPDTLIHAGVPAAELLVCTLPDSLLKGTNNVRLVRRLREMNPRARIIAVSESLSGVAALRAAGADFVSVPRLSEAESLWRIVREAERGSLETARGAAEQRLQGRSEIIP